GPLGNLPTPAPKLGQICSGSKRKFFMRFQDSGNALTKDPVARRIEAGCTRPQDGRIRPVSESRLVRQSRPYRTPAAADQRDRLLPKQDRQEPFETGECLSASESNARQPLLQA